MKYILSLLIILHSFGDVYSQNIRWERAFGGEYTKTGFVTAPFPHKKREAGYMYGEKLYPAAECYSDSSVFIFIPESFRPSEAINLVVYFHGWGSCIDSTIDRYRLTEQFSNAHMNAIFVLPQCAKFAPDSYGGKLEDKNGFSAFIDEVLDFLNSEKGLSVRGVKNIILAGHSGGYRTISYILLRGGMNNYVSGVILLDALYGGTEKFIRWIEQGKGSLINIYTDAGGTKNETQYLMEDLEEWGFPFYAAEEQELSNDSLAKSRLSFIHSVQAHGEVIAKDSQFERFLKAISKNAGIR